MRRLVILASLAVALVLGGAAHAQTIYGFGDSLLDTRVLCKYAGYPGSATYGTCSNGEGALEFLPTYARYSFAKANDYAIGGATTGVTNSEITNFTAAGGRIGANDLVVMSGSPNNVGMLSNPGVTGASLAASTLIDIGHGVAALVAAGARNLVYYGGSPADGGVSEGSGTEAAAFSNGVNAGLPGVLAPYAKPGVRVRILDFEAVYVKANLDPSYYGFTAVGECVQDPACVHAPLAVQDQRFQYDIHPTQAGEQLLAEYIGRLITSDDGLAAQADITSGASDAFSASILRRLEAGRPYGASGYGAVEGGRIGLILGGGYTQTNRNDWAGLGGAATGYTDDENAITLGATYRADAHTTTGFALGYARSEAHLHGAAGEIDVDSFHVADMLSLAWADHFIDLIVGYSRHNLSENRPAVVDRIDGDTQADTFTVAGQGAWLFLVGPFQIGPLVNGHYDHTRVGAYTEKGDPILTQKVDAQTEETLNLGAGVQVRTTFAALGRSWTPFLDVTAQQSLLSGGRTLTSENTFALTLPIYTVIDGARQARTYGLVNAGVQTPLWGGIDLVVDGEATMERSGSAYALNLALTRRF